MQAFGLATLGKDAEVRTTPSGETVANLSLAFSHYDKTAENNRATQWVDATIWGKRAEALAQYLRKGQRVSVTLDDVHIQQYEGKNGTGHKLVGRVSNIDLAGERKESNAPAPAHRQAPRPAPAPAPRQQSTGSGFDEMADDVPW